MGLGVVMFRCRLGGCGGGATGEKELAELTGIGNHPPMTYFTI